MRLLVSCRAFCVISHNESRAVSLVPQDYLVLLPQDYYEAPLLREQITQPCTYSPTASRDAK